MHAGLLQHSGTRRHTRCMLDGACSQLSRHAVWYGLALNSWRSISFIILHLAPLNNTQNSRFAPAHWEPDLHGTRSYSAVLVAECVMEEWWNMPSKVKITYSGEGWLVLWKRRRPGTVVSTQLSAGEALITGNMQRMPVTELKLSHSKNKQTNK